MEKNTGIMSKPTIVNSLSIAELGETKREKNGEIRSNPCLISIDNQENI